MILPSDKEYRQTKLIKQGKAEVNSFFIPLANWIDETYDVQTLNIFYDTIDNDKTPRLQICLEYERDKQKFNSNNQYNYDKTKQVQIAQEFKRLLEADKSTADKNLLSFSKPKSYQKYEWKNIWVFFSAFESIAKIEATEKVPESKIEKLKEEIGNPDIWGISRAFSGVTFFLYTDSQVKKYQRSTESEVWKDKYFKLIKNYDEFDYFKKDSLQFYLDSKENFDTNYESNWFYYYK